MELAVVTYTSPDDWRYQDDATIATAVDVLEKRAEAERKAMSKSKGRRRG